MTHEEYIKWFAAMPPVLKKLRANYRGEEDFFIYPPDADGNFSISDELSLTKAEMIALGHELIALAETPRTAYVAPKKEMPALIMNVQIDPQTGNIIRHVNIASWLPYTDPKHNNNYR